MFLPIFLTENSIDSIKVGFIDVEKNSGKTPYPTLMSDIHVHLYPSYNKSANASMIGSRSLYSIISLINQNSEQKLPENEALFESEYELSFLTAYINEYETFDQHSKTLIDTYISQMGYKLGLGSNLEEVRTTVLEQEGMDANQQRIGNYKFRNNQRKRHL